MSNRQIFSISDFTCSHIKFFSNAVEVKKSIKIVSGPKTECTIGDLSPFIDPNSIKLVSNAQISDVVIQKVPQDLSLMKELEDEIRTETTKLQNLYKKIKLLNRFGQSVADQGDLDKFFTFLDSFSSKESLLESEIKKCEEKIKILKENFQEKNSLRSNEVKFLVQTNQSDFDVSLEIFYQISGIGWTPQYDFRFNSKSKNLFINIYALVEQKINEEWSDTEASFWPCKINSNWQTQLVKFKTLQSKSVQQMLEEMRSHMDHKTKNTSVAQSQLGDNFCSVVYPEEKISIKTGLNKILIFQVNLSPDFRYEAIAGMSSELQIKAKVKNTSGFVFLEGDISIYLNGGFMSNRRIKNWCILEEIEMFVGTDDSVQITLSPLSIFKAKMVDRKNSYVLEQKFCVSNGSDHLREFFVWNFFPISSDEKISVKLLEPSTKQNSKVKFVKQGCLEFCFNLEPGEKCENFIKYSIDYPLDKQIELY